MKNRILLFILSLFVFQAHAQWIQQGADINGETVLDSSGVSVSLSSDGNTVAIGSRNNGSRAEHVRVYKRISGAWTQQGADIDG